MRTGAHPLGIHHDDRSAGHLREQGRHAFGQDGDEPFHAFDVNALGQLCAHLGDRGDAVGQATGPRADLVGEDEFADGRGEQALGREFEGSLVGDREAADLLDRVAPELQAERMLLGRRKHVEDAAAHRHLATSFDQIHAFVAEERQSLDQRGQIGGTPRAQPHRLDVADAERDGLRDRADRGHEHVDRREQVVGFVGMGESPQDADASAHRVRRG